MSKFNESHDFFFTLRGCVIAMSMSWVGFFSLYDVQKYLAYCSVAVISWVSLTLWKGRYLQGRFKRNAIKLAYSILMVASLALTMKLSPAGEVDKLIFLGTQGVVALLLTCLLLPYDKKVS